jgi:phospholipase/carboxylesterase
MNAEVIEGGALDYVLVTPKQPATDGALPLVVLLHGFGANMYDLANLAPAIDPAGYVYAFPNAPYGLMGMGGFSWSANRPGAVAPSGPERSVEERLETLTAELIERMGAQAGGIILGGFSQGAGLSLTHGLVRPDVFTGLVVLSGFFRDAEEVGPKLPPERSQPVFLVHGTQDPIVPIEQGRATRDFLESAGYSPEYHEYAMPHAVTPDVIRDLVAWLHRVLPADASMTS